VKEPQAKLFFYFNGFNSAILEDFSGSLKIQAVADHARKRNFLFLPVSINFRRLEDHSRAILQQVGDDAQWVVFCGSSMGGWFARIMQLQLAQRRPELPIDAIAFNPAFDLGIHGPTLVGPQKNHVTGEEYEWTAEHSEQLKNIENAVDYDAALPFHVYVDRGDEIIAWRHSASRHSTISRFRDFEGGCHSFDHYREALEDFDGACWKRA
jgi:predicted esterase YcpF (UPF0227 family)